MCAPSGPAPFHLADSHCHLTDPWLAPDREVALRRAGDAGVALVIDAADGLGAAQRALDLAAGPVWVTCGIHPNQASQAPPDAVERLRALLQHPRAVGVGETGLDYFRKRATREDQWSLFRAQLALAQDLGLPVVVHSRDAAEDTLRLLREFPGVRGVMHCFSYDWPTAAACLDLGFSLSLAGPLTYPRTAALAEAARRAPLDRLLVETDAPYLPPQSRRGQRNEPAHVVETLRRLADLRGEAPATVASATLENTYRMFGITH